MPKAPMFISFPGDTVWKATKRGDLETVKKFVERDGVPDVEDDYYDDHESLLTVACKFGHLEVVRYLLEVRKANNEFRPYAPEAFVALEAGRLNVLELLCEFGLDASDSRVKHGESLLCAAARDRQFEAMRVLANHGADMTTYIYEKEVTEDEASIGEWPSEIELAARAGDIEYVELLLEIGADSGNKSAEDYLALARENQPKWEKKREEAWLGVQEFRQRKEQELARSEKKNTEDEATAIWFLFLFVYVVVCGVLLWLIYLFVRQLWIVLGGPMFVGVAAAVIIVCVLWRALKARS